MGIGRKAHGDTTVTSASSDESSCVPSEMACSLSNSALEAAAQFSEASNNPGTQSWERSEVTSEGKSSSDDAPSSLDVGNSEQHQDNDKSEEVVAKELKEKELKKKRKKERKKKKAADQVAKKAAASEVETNKEVNKAGEASDADEATEAEVAPQEEQRREEETEEFDSEADEADEAGEVGEPGEAVVYEAVVPHEEEPASEPVVKRKKKRGAALHAAAASSTTETPPPTLLHAKQRKKKQIEMGSSESSGDPGQVESEPMVEDAEGSEMPVEKKTKSRKKRLSLGADTDGESTGEAAKKQGKPKKRKTPEQSADSHADVQPKAKKAPKQGRSSYVFFSIEQRKLTEISELGFVEAGKEIGARWNALSADKKSTYEDMAKVDKMRHQREKKKWEAEHGAPEARPKPKQKKRKAAKAPKPTEESSEDDEPAPSSDELATASDAPKATKPRVLPMPLLELGTLVPRTKHPMRSDSVEVGDKVVWVPQAFDVFISNYDAILQQLSLPSLPDDVSTDLMRRPADGTANGAEVLKISEPEEFAPGLKDQLHGWQLLRLKSLALPDEAGADDLEYNLPVVRRPNCDVDMHICGLKQYEASKRWKAGCGSESQVSVRFAISESQEEEWEGRIWDEQPYEPKEYPNSKYKRLRLLWYVKSSDDPNEQTPANTKWIMDPDQTDIEVSPWEARPSTSHLLWVKKNQELAKFNEPRLDRSTLRKLVPQPESEQVCPEAMQNDGDKEISEQLVERVLKQICSIEATEGLWHPVNKSEKDYYAYVKHPISLSVIDGKWRAGKYVGQHAWRAFAADVQLLVDNAQDFNDDDTLWFSLAGMVQREMQHAINQIAEHWPQLLEA